MKINRINLGEIIRQRVDDLGLRQAEFARQIGMQRQNVSKLVFEKASLDTNLLAIISEVLDCNFFDYYSSGSDKNELTEIKATITIELGKEKKDRTVRFVFGENEIKI